MKIAISILALVVLPMFANAGNETGNGGDSVASEFIVVATDLAIRIQKAGIKHPLLDLDLLNTAILLTEVYSKERSFLRGREVDAINFPDLVEIQVSRRRWITGTEQFPMHGRLILVLHEYLGIMGLDDSQYNISKEIIGQLDLKDYSIARWLRPLIPFNVVEIRMAHGKTCAAANLRFHGDKSNERVASVIVTCGGEWRKIVIDKSFYAVPKKESRLLVAHAFEINVYSSASTKKPVDSIEAVPKIGVCDDNQQCTAEVEYEVGGVIFTFKSKIDPNQSDL